jgi:hypothetical protein
MDGISFSHLTEVVIFSIKVCNKYPGGVAAPVQYDGPQTSHRK